MYVITRKLYFEKDKYHAFLEHAKQEPPMISFKGFNKIDVFVDSTSKEEDVIILMMYFEDKKAFHRWEGSDTHIAMHKDKQHSHHQKPEGLIKAERFIFEHIHTTLYRE